MRIGLFPEPDGTTASGVWSLDEVFGYMSNALWPVFISDNYSQVVLADSPVGYWRLGEASGTVATDLGSGGNNGTYSGSPTLGVTGALTGDDDTAVTFDGTDDYVTCGDVGSSEAAFSVEAWFKHPDNGADSRLIMSEGNTTTEEGMLLYLVGTSGNARFYLINTALGATFATSSAALDDDAWHHIVGTFDGTNMRLYVDGVLDATTARSSNYPPVTRTYIGYDARKTPTSPGYFNGEIDEAATYDTALTPSQIRRHYYRGLGYTGYALEVLVDAPTNYWRLGESSGTTATDLGSGGNDGTYTNSPTLGATGLLTGDDTTSVDFDGTNDHVTSATDGPSGDISFEAWIDSDTNSASTRVVGNHSNHAGNGNHFHLSLGALISVAWDDGTEQPYVLSPSLSTGTTYHVVGVCDDSDGTITMYLDGVDVGSTTPTAWTGYTADANIYIGARQDDLSEPFNGQIQEVAVYDTALSAARVLAHYNAGT